MERKTIAKKSSMIGVLLQMSTVLLRFLSRKAFLATIGLDYLGLNSTLTQILGALTVSELGIQTVIIYKLYKPIVENEKDKINEIMSVFRLLYWIVAAIIGIGGIIVTPFLKYIITNVSIPIKDIYLAWIIMVFTTAFSYLLSYNGAILYADQKQYLVLKINLVVNVVIVTVDIILLYIFKQYYIHLVLNMLCTVLPNFFVVLLRRRLYPWLSFIKPSIEKFKDVAKSALDVFAGKACGYIFNSTDSIVISTFIGTTMVGYLGNYTTLFYAAAAVISSICGPIQTLAGNLIAENENRDISEFVKNFSYTIYLIGTFLYVPTILLVNDFIAMFYGEEYKLGYLIILLLSADVYISMAQSSTGSILDSAGKFKIERKFYIYSSIINIVASIIGAITIGIAGVLLGTVIGRIYLWFERAYHCFYDVMDQYPSKFKEYIKYNIKYIVVFCFCIFSLYEMFSIWPGNVTVANFICKGIISVAFVGIVQLVVFWKTSEFRYVIRLIGIGKFDR